MSKVSLLSLLILMQSELSYAHHAFAADYEKDNIGAIEGEVIEVFYKNPHARYYVEVDGENGQKEVWDVQTMNVTMLSRMGWKKDTVKAGDKVMVTGNLGRNNTKRINILSLKQEDGTVLKPLGGGKKNNSASKKADGTAASMAAAIPTGRYRLDTDHAYLSFSYSHLGLSFPKLRFAEFDGELDLNGADMKESSIHITIDAASIDTALPEFNAELQGDKYFDVKNYPVLTYKSMGYEEISPTTGRITGELTVKDITKLVTLDVTINAANQSRVTRKNMIGFSATGTLLRSDFGLGMMTPMIGDEVSILIQSEFENVPL